MRRISAVAFLLGLWALAPTAFGQTIGCSSCEHFGTMGAPACCGGNQFSGMTPGCCEFSPSACDNAWAGYCEEKAKWKAFWHRVGTGACVQRHGASSGYPTPAMYYPAQPTAAEMPAVAPQAAPSLPTAPQPAPEPQTWGMPRYR